MLVMSFQLSASVKMLGCRFHGIYFLTILATINKREFYFYEAKSRVAESNGLRH